MNTTQSHSTSGRSVRRSMYTSSARRMVSFGAAAALVTSGAMMALPASAADAGALGVQQAQTQQQSDPQPAKVARATDEIIHVDAIANGYVPHTTALTNRKNTLSGRAFIADFGTPATASNGLTPVPHGTTVYMQWMDKDGSVSPIYSTQTHPAIGAVDAQGGDGVYAFDLREGWEDSFGTKHVYTATAGQHYRIWIEPFTNPATGNQLSLLRQAGGYYPSFINSVTDNNIGQFPLVGTNMQRTALFMYEHPGSYMKATGERLVESTEPPITSLISPQLHTSNTYSGVVWFETSAGDRANSASGPVFNNLMGDKAAKGYTVYASTLTPEGAKANKAILKLPVEEQAAATKAMLEAHPEYILKTVYTKTDEKGRYTLRFGDYSDKKQKSEDFYDPDNTYMWVEDPSGQVVQSYSPHTSHIFRDFNDNTSWVPQAAPGHNDTVTSRAEDIGNPRYGKPVHTTYNANFALVPWSPVTLDITNFDTGANTASPKDVAELDLAGTLPPWVTPLFERTRRATWLRPALTSTPRSRVRSASSRFLRLLSRARFSPPTWF